METNYNQLNRREFLSTLTMASGLLALGLTPGVADAEFLGFGKRARTGISDAAYQKAWERAVAMVNQMNLEEKIGQLGHQSHVVERLKLPAYNYYTGEALHGLTHPAPATSFPVPLALAAAWNPELALRIYTAISDEARAYDNRQKIGLSYYSPVTLNLHRDPRWGRCLEAPGEDPCLASTFAVQVVRGMQGDNPHYLKTTACSKHYICNNTDDDRTKVSPPVDARSFWEYYTRAYRATILEGDVFSIMGAYSGINGVPCCANKFLLTDLLRGQWGFRGYVTSDCDAVANIYIPHHYADSYPIASAMAVLAGCDLDCGGTLQRYSMEAVHQELMSEEDIGLAVTRLLTVRHLLGLFDSPEEVPYTQIPFEVVDCDAHRALALEAARQSLVLLKNDSNFLPLDKTALKKVAVIGPLAGTCHLGGYSGTPKVNISPYQGIAASLGVPAFLPYIPATETVATSDGIRPESTSEGRMSLAYIDDGAWAEYAKADFTGKTEFQARVSSKADGGRIEVHLDKLDGPLACTLTVPVTGGWQKWVNVSASLSGINGEHSIFLSFHGSGGKSLMNIETFQLNPYSPPPAQPGQSQVVYLPGCSVTGAKDETTFNEAVDAAKDADVVILVCGVNEEVDREGHDRDTIELTGVQPDLIQAVYAVNPKTVLVLSSNNSVAVNWEQDHLPAILCAVCAGQAQGTAIAQALFGEYNPGGKLPCTWYRSLDQLPDFHDYNIHAGRTYMYFADAPLYPFGYGLSYTTFKLEGLMQQSTTLGPGEKTKISLDVINTGNRSGAEVVQLYITPPASPVKRPIKQLAGFQRVELQPGEKKTVTFELSYSEQAFWYWDEKAESFVLQPGAAKILVGNSSANIVLTGELTLEASEKIQNDRVDTVAVKSSIS
jgi:beta-glucosidase